ncbi:scaffold/adaptor protein [Lithospermum erythrorhizon]|uniref:Scaffold/adaptor protein n=1 Tax=Lithospermum erythrorhizon TaxID=34254 RepID=A0AAV3QJF3_LITER
MQKVKKTCKSDYVKLVNADYLTAEKLFAQSNETLHAEAKDWMKRTSENCSLVAVLIATVAFAAAYTVPGGVDDKTGIPVLVNDAFFITFAIADVLSITFSLTSVVVFLSILTSPYQMIHFKRELPRRIILAFTLLLLGVSMMMVAFSATIILTIKENGAWVKILLYSMASLPVFIFLLSYLKLYKEFWKTLVESVVEAFNMCPRKRSGGDEESKHSFHYSSSFALEDEGYSV